MRLRIMAEVALEGHLRSGFDGIVSAVSEALNSLGWSAAEPQE